MVQRLLLALLVVLSMVGVFGTNAHASQVPTVADHVVIVLLENTSYSSVTSTSMPWLTSMAAKNARLNSYYATTHPSIGNYFSLTAGTIFTNSDGYSSTLTIDNIVRHSLAAGVDWKAYEESLPSVGYTGKDVYPYVEHHDPLSYFSDVRNSSVQKLNLVPFTHWATDVANNHLPKFSFITPNMHDDAHDCPTTSSCSLTTKLQHADSWMKTNLASLLATPDFQTGGRGVLIVVFDEAATSDTHSSPTSSTGGGGHVFATVISPMVKAGYVSTTPHTHYGMLKTIMELLGESSFPAKAASATDFSEIFPSAAAVAWKPSVSSGVTGYNVYRSTTSGSGFSKVGSTASLSYVDKPGSGTFYYVVTALEGTLESKHSAQASVTLP